MESCQKRDQEIIRYKGHHHACRFDCDQPNDILVDDMDMRWAFEEFVWKVQVDENGNKWVREVRRY